MLLYLMLALFPPADSQCALTLLGDGYCDRVCMTPLSNFDTLSDGNSDCDEICSSHCELSILGNGVCNPSCNTWDCRWDGGDCGMCAESCEYSRLGDGICDQACISPACSWDAGDCNSVSSQNFVYVSPVGDRYGAGTDIAPYTSIAQAVESLWLPVNTVWLLDGVHSLTKVTKSVLLTQKSLQRTTIATLLCSGAVSDHVQCSDSRASVVLSSDFLSFSIVHTVVFSSISLIGEFPLRADCALATCLYCPYLLFNTEIGEYVNDREEIVDKGDYAEQKICDWYHDKAFITVGRGGGLVITDSSFSRFRQQLAAVIDNQCGSVTLEMVDFDDNVPNPAGLGGGLIRQTCPDDLAPYYCGSFSYTTGTISRLNNGYEYRSDLVLSGFLSMDGLTSFYMQNLTFQYNFAPIGDSITNFDSSLLVLQRFRQVTIQNCTFRFNVASLAVGLSVVHAMKFPMVLGDGNVAVEHSIRHIVLTELVFENNTARVGTVLYVHFQTNHQNIILANSTFVNNFCSKGPLIYIQNDQMLRRYADGEFVETWYQGAFLNIWIPPRYFNTSNLTFRDNYAVALVWIRDIGNVNINAIDIVNNGESRLELNADDYVIQSYVNNNDYYVSKVSIVGAWDFVCRNGFVIDSVLKLSLFDLNFTSNYCPDGSPGLSISSSPRVLSFHHISFTNSIGSELLTLTVSSVMTLASLAFRNNTNLNSSNAVCFHIEMSTPSAVSISRSVFTANKGDSAGVGTVFNVKSLSLDDITIEDTVVNYSCAGILFSPYPYAASQLRITGSRFLRNKSDSYGVVTVLDFQGVLSGNLLSVLTVTITDSVFEDNHSLYSGAGITIDNFVQLSDSSYIANCAFRRNESQRGAAVLLTYQTGVVTIRQCQFAGNIASEGGAGVFAKQYEDTVETPTFVILQDSNFTDSSGAAVSISGYAKVSSLYSTRNRFERNRNGAVVAILGLFNDSFSTYIENKAQNGPGISLKSASIGVVESAVFRGNSAESSGGALYIGSQCIVSVTSSAFGNNSAGVSGGVAFADSSLLVGFSQSNFTRNTANVSAAMLYSLFGSIRLHHVSIANNSAVGYALFVLLQATITVTESNISANTAPERTSGLMLSSCSLIITDSLLSSQSSIDGGFILGLNNNIVRISRSVFVAGIARSEGGAIYLTLESELIIEDSRFEQCSAGLQGGALAIGKSSFSGTNLDFVSISAPIGGGIDIKDSKITLERCRFRHVSGGAVRVTGGTMVNITESRFENADSKAYRGAGVYSVDSSPVTISDCFFTGNNAEKGGGVYLYSTIAKAINDKYTVVRTLFEGNWGPTGGGLGSDGVDLVLDNNTFANNSAVFVLNSLAITNGEGGGVNIRCDNAIACAVVITRNRFVRNRASISGGAVRWQETVPKFEGNLFDGNEAVYGANTASYAVALAPVSETGERIQYVDNSSDVPVAVKIEEFVSGRQYQGKLKFGLFDHVSQLVTVDNISSIEILNSDNVSISGSTKDICSQGIFEMTDFAITAPPGSSQLLTLWTNGVDRRKKMAISDSVQFYDVVSVKIEFRQCQTGETRTSEGACSECPAETYSLDPEKPCKTCLSTAICYGGFIMVPRKGYWRVSNTTDVFFECPNSEACIGSPEPPDASLTGLCSVGYSGNLCQVCQKDFSRTGRNSCALCPGRTANISVSILIVIVALSAIALVISFGIRGATRPRSLIAIYFKIFLNYLQMVVVAASMNLNWPSFVKTFLSTQELAGGVTEQLFSFECLMKDFTPASEVGMYTSKLVIGGLLPMAIMLVALLGWVLLLLTKHISLLIPKLVSSFVVVIFILHPSVTKLMFSVFSCMEIHPGEKWLISDLSERCWTSSHIRTMLIVAVPSIAVWVLGLPAVVLGLLIRQRKGLGDLRCKLKFSFLFKGYEARWFYWEFVILYRKVAIVGSSVFLSPVSIKVESLTILAILLAAIYLQLRYQPFNDPTLNKLEVKSILVSAITIYTGLYYDTQSMGKDYAGEGINVLLFVAIIVSNAYFLATWVVYISPVIAATIRERWKRLTHLRKNYRVQPSTTGLKDAEKPDISSSSIAIASSSPFEQTVNVGEGIESITPPPENTPVRISREVSEPNEEGAKVSFRDS